MFLGHYAVGLAAKKWAPKVSLGTLFLASVGLDLLWALFLLLGWEMVAISPGVTKVIPIDFTDYSLSHSLVMAFAWAILVGVISLLVTKNEQTSLLLAGLVVSHWFLNVVVHRPDLHLLPSGNPMDIKWGLGLWNSVPGTIAVEILLFAVGIYVYLKSTKAGDSFGQWSFWILSVLMAAVFVGIFFIPTPKSPLWVGVVVGQVEVLFVVLAYWVDAHRKPV